MTVVIAVCSWITVPFAVPFTLQTFGVFLALRALGGRNGCISVGAYILLGAVGVPVYSGFTGGIGHLIGPTGGYIFGFLAAGVVYAALEKAFPGRVFPTFAKMCAGLAACYALGAAWFAVSYGSDPSMGLRAALTYGVLPYVVPDLIKLALAELIARKLKSRGISS